MTTTRRGRSGGHRLTRTLRRRRHFGREWIRVGMGWKTERELLRICSKIGGGRRRWRRSPSWSSTRVRAHPSSGRLTIRRLWRWCLLLPTIRLGDVVTVFSRTTSTATFSRQLGHIRTGRRCCPRLFSGWRVGQPFDLDGEMSMWNDPWLLGLPSRSLPALPVSNSPISLKMFSMIAP